MIWCGRRWRAARAAWSSPTGGGPNSGSPKRAPIAWPCARSWRSRTARRWSRCCRCAPSNSCASAWAWSAGRSRRPSSCSRSSRKPEEVDTRVAFNLMSGVVASTGRLAPFGTVSAALRVRIVGPVGIELRGLAPFGSQELAGPKGPIDTSVWLAGGGLVLAPRTAARVAFDIGAGALAAMRAQLRHDRGTDRRRRRDRRLRARRRPHPPQPELVGPPRRDRGEHRPAAHHHHGHTRQDVTTWGLGIRLRAGRHRAGDMSRQPGGLTLTG